MTRLQKVTIVTSAKAIHKIHCDECNWEQFIAAETDAPLKSCPWCGWNDLNISAISKLGGYPNIHCEKHGDVTVMLPNENIVENDFMDNLFCPFCD